MAEVFGTLGDQPVELNNAATEATLRELVTAIGLMAAKLNTTKKTQAEVEKELRSFQKQLQKTQDAQKNLNAEQKEAYKAAKEKRKAEEEAKKAEEANTKAKEESAKATYAIAKGFNLLGQTAAGLATKMTGLLSSLSNVGNSMSSAASAMNNVPVVGGVLSSVFGAVAEASEKLLKSYQEAASVGVTFGGSINNMVNAASGAGLTFDQFAGIVAKNGEALALLGGTSERGAKMIAQMGKEIRNSNVGTELLALGYSTEQVNNGMAGYMGMMARTGATQGKSTAELARGAGQYLKELDGLSKLTGQSREALQKEQEARLKDSQFRAMLVGKTEEEQRNIQALMSAIPEEHKEAFKDMLSTGNMTSDAAIKFAAAMPGAAQAAMAAGRDIQNGGKITRDAMGGLYKDYINEGKRVEKSAFYQTQAQYNMDEFGKTMIGVNEAASRSADGFDKALADQKKTTDTAAQNQAAQMEQFKQRLAETSNVFTQILAQSGMLEKLEQAFDMLVGITLDYVVPAFEWMFDNFNTIAVVAGVLIGAYTALSAVIMIANGITALRTIAETASIAPLVAMAAAAWALVAPVLAAAAPFIAVAAAVAGVIYIFKKMGGSMDTITDGLKIYWSMWKSLFSYLKLGFYKLLDLIPGINFKKEIEETEKEIVEQKQDRENLVTKIQTDAANNRAKQEEEAQADAKKTGLDKARERIAAREAAKADRDKKEAADKATEADKSKAEAAQGVANGVGAGDPLRDMMLYNKQKAEAAAAGANAAGGVPQTTGGGTPPPINQDQKKNMDMIEASLKKQGITDPKMIAAIKGNVMKESGGKSISENMNYGGTDNKRIRDIFGSRAAGKSDAELNDIKKDPSKMGEMMYGKDTKIGQGMGNTEAGDGFKYRGRGFVQLTGKNNYAAASKAIYGDDRLVKNPDMVNDPQVAADVAAWYMKRGTAGMAKQLGVDQGNMTQEQANLVATSTIAGRAIKPGQGYLGQEALDKVNRYSAAFATGQQPLDASGRATATTDPRVAKTAVPNTPATPPVTPTPAVAATAGTQMVMVGDKSYVKDSPEHKAALAAEEAKKKNATQPGAPKPGEKPQESVETLLAQLNSQVGELLAVTRDSKRVNERQLGVMADNSSNLYAMGA